MDEGRSFHVNDREQNKEKQFPGNGVTTSRYTLLTFIPVNLLEQFRRVANFYFLVTVLLQLIPNVSPFPLWTVASPLAFILAVSAIKAAYEDWFRHVDDWRANNKIHFRVNDGGVEQIRSKNICVGDILKLSKNEVFPSDCIVLATSNHDRSCYVNTAELDGETAPKSKRAPISGVHATDESVSSMVGSVSASIPAPQFNGFEGRLQVDRANDVEESKQVPLGDDQLALRGSKVDSTEYVYAIAYATGNDTKLMLNRSGVSFKFSSFESKLNRCVLISLCIQFVINITFAIGSSFSEQYEEIDAERSFAENMALEFLTSFVLFTYLIPISLYVTMEFVRVGQGMIMTRDDKLSVEEWVLQSKLEAEREAEEAVDTEEALPSMKSDMQDQKVRIRKRINVRTTDINDELGQVEYIMSDKTGTLTKNKMELKHVFVDGMLLKNGDVDALSKKEQFHVTELIQAVFWDDEKEAADAKEKLTCASMSQDASLSRARDFILTLLCCNDVLVMSDAEKGLDFQSLSPDEIAFVEALHENGITLSKSSDSQKDIEIKQSGSHKTELHYTVHGMLKFSADRKRMTCVVQENGTDNYFVFCKGADAMLEQFLQQTDLEQKLWKGNDEALTTFAKSGNRTLVMASRKLDQGSFDEWKTAFSEASLSLSSREEKIEAAFSKVEKDMVLCGTTAVEDPLQDGVPAAIDALIEAEIVVIVLTGDKEETAVAIGKDANIVHHDTHLMFIHATQSEHVLRDLKEHHEYCNKPESVKQALVIGGNALEIAINSHPDTFLDLLAHCQTVICSRATPSQKAAMVILVKTRLKKICLAIGDGANDVSMIQKAQVGVGLTGKEGNQAAQSSDFVLHRFRHLPHLLLTHGRYSYYRVCKVVYWSFYKNALFPFPMFLYGFFSDFSSQIFYDALILTCFNTIFTVLPPLAIGFTEKDAPEEMLLKYPQVYASFRREKQFRSKEYVRWLLFAALNGILIFFIAYGVFYNTDVITDDGKTTGLWVLGMHQCTVVVLVINLTFLIDTENWTPVMLLSCFLGVFCYFLGFAAYGWWIELAPDIYGITNYILATGVSYLYTYITTAVCCVPLVMYKVLHTSFYPDHLARLVQQWKKE